MTSTAPRMRPLALTVTALVALGGFVSAAPAAEAKRPNPKVVAVLAKRLPPCHFEDGSGGPLPCFWNGDTRGSRNGVSYWVDRNERYHYLTKIKR